MVESAFSDVLVDRLAAARSVTVLTGAGISAESGVPTFRDPGGLWERFRPEELANVHAFLNNPALVQAWYRHRRKVCADTLPNPGHLALVELEELVEDFTLITQNVDGLHARAGARRVIELHGNITRAYCIDCGRAANEEALSGGEDGATVVCESCGGLIRPDVVWFGEMLPDGAMEAAYEAARRANVFLSVGTSAVVYPAAGIPEVARQAGAYVVEVNVEPSAIAARMHEVLVGPAGRILPALVSAVRERMHM